MDPEFPDAEQFILYEGDAVEVLFSDGGRLQVSPCGTIFVYQHLSPLSVEQPIQQKTQFTTSSYRRQVKDALEFRNQFATCPFLCQELLEPEHIIRSPLDIFEFFWPSKIMNENIEVLDNGSVKLMSVTTVGTQPVAVIWLSATRRTFILRCLVKLKHGTTKNSEPQNDARSHKQFLPRHSLGDGRVSNDMHSKTLRRVIDFDDGDTCKTVSELPIDDGVLDASIGAPFMEYAWVTQHHSVSSYPPRWSHPVELLLQFCNSSSFSSYLSKLRMSKSQKQTTEPSIVEADCVHSYLPNLMPLRCSSPHLHRWNPSASDDVCGYFHDKVKVVAIKGTVYRLLWNTNPRLVEVYPPDGSIIQSTGESGHHYTHFFFSRQSHTIEDRTYSWQSPPPVSVDLPYSVSRLVLMAHRLFDLMSDKYLDLATKRQVCWKVKPAAKCLSPSTVMTQSSVIDECSVSGVGRFTAYVNGSVHVVFEDRTCLDMHGIQWEPHVFEKILLAMPTDDDAERFMSDVRASECVARVNFSNDVCRLLLPSGHYQHVNILKPDSLYESYVSSALEYVRWVNTPINQRDAFYSDSLDNQKLITDLELMKIRGFTSLLDRALGNTETIQSQVWSPPIVTSSLADGTGMSGDNFMGMQGIAKHALNDSARMLKDLDSFLSEHELRKS